MRLSLKTKLMITFFVLISVPMSGLGYVSYKMASSSIQATVQQQLKEETSNTADLIEKSIYSVKKTIEISSLNQQIGKASQNASKDDVDAAFEYIQSVQKDNKDFIEELIITDANGKVVIDSDTKEPNIDLGDRDYMKKSISSGSETVSEVLTSRFTGNSAIFITYPIKKGDKVIGTLVGSIRFDSISSYASKIKVGQNGYAYMIDKNGLFVYHPDSNKILKENAGDIASDGLKSIVNEMKDGKTSEGFYTYNNIYKYVVFQPVDNWTIAVTANYDEYMAPAISIKNYTIIIVSIAIIISMICAYLYSTKRIINPIKELEELMKRAGNGDLTVSINIDSKDEIEELGKSFNEMINHQDEIVKSVINAAQQLNAASEEIASSAEEASAETQEISSSITQVANDAEKQNDLIIDVAKVLVQLSSLVQLAQNRAQAASSNAINTMKVAELGRDKVEKTVKAMKVINTGSNETEKVLKALNQLSTKAGSIINTINSIAEQTNLLALNAAIEAARAGEYGKGFSVVADEVRKLSEESNDRAKEIDTLVNEMMSQTRNAVSVMEKSKEEVDNGVMIVSETDEAFVNIINAIKNIVENTNEIFDITNDEVASSDKVVTLINEVATLTENNSMNSENVASSASEQAKAIEGLTAVAEETSAMSEELTTLVEKFII